MRHQYPYHKPVKSGQRRQPKPYQVPPSLQGENYPTHKLTEAGVARLWELRKLGWGSHRICKTLLQEGHRTSPSTVQRILDGFSWKKQRPDWAK
jgi:hypothetical protein